MIALGPHAALQQVHDGIVLTSQHRKKRLMRIDGTDRLGVITLNDSDVAAFLNLEDADGHAVDPQKNSSRNSGQPWRMAHDQRPLP